MKICVGLCSLDEDISVFSEQEPLITLITLTRMIKTVCYIIMCTDKQLRHGEERTVTAVTGSFSLLVRCVLSRQSTGYIYNQHTYKQKNK